MSTPLALTRPALTRLGLLLAVRGCLLLALAALAVRWPEDLLVSAMTVAAGTMGILGVFEFAVAAVTPARRPARRLMLLHATVSMTFGVATLAIALASAGTTVAVVSLWLLLHASVALALAARVSGVATARHALAAWSAVNLVSSFVVAAGMATGMAFPTLGYFGAGYAAVYAVMQLGAARWLMRQPDDVLQAAGVLKRPGRS